MLNIPPVFLWCSTVVTAKLHDKVADTGKACFLTDFMDGHIGIFQVGFSSLEAYVHQVSVGSQSGFCLKSAD